MLLFGVMVAFLGLIFGSFGGVILERGQEHGFSRQGRGKILGGRSYCPGCRQTLTRWQLIPVVGRIIQKGKCFRCKQSIPSRYLRFEVSMATVFVITGYGVTGGDFVALTEHISLMVTLIFRLGVNWALVCLMLADFFRYELNVYIRLLLLMRVILFVFLLGLGNPHIAFRGGIIFTALFRAIYQLAKRYATKKYKEPTEGFGQGDVMMALVLGLLFVFVIEQLPRLEPILIAQGILVYLVLSSLVGLVYRWGAGFWIGNRNQRIPFLPGMITAYWLLMRGIGVFL